MARLRKCKLTWKASDEGRVAGYMIYWSSGTTVGYDSNCIIVGKVAEIAIPEQVLSVGDGPVMFGITAIDRDGNESDMTTIAEPYVFQVPQAPRALRLEPVDEFLISEASDEEIIEPELIRQLISQLDGGDAPDPVVEESMISGQQADEAPVRFDIGTVF